MKRRRRTLGNNDVLVLHCDGFGLLEKRRLIEIVGLVDESDADDGKKVWLGVELRMLLYLWMGALNVSHEDDRPRSGQY